MIRLGFVAEWQIWMLAIGVLTGCALHGMSPGMDPMIAPGHVLTLPDPGELGRSVEAAQLITVRREDETQVFEGHISVTPDRFLLVGVDGMGRRALTLSWDKSGKISAETASWMPRTIPPGPMLADIFVLYWPEAVVRRALQGSRATLAVGKGSRSVMADGVRVLHAVYEGSNGPSWSGTLRYRNEAWCYDIEVQSVELTP